MPVFTSPGGISIHYEVYGEGVPLMFLHELSSDMRQWALQVSHFARRYQVITYNTVGYPPSDVAESPGAYTLDKQVEIARALLEYLACGSAHCVGISMGAHTSLGLAMAHSECVKSVVLVGGGSGSGSPSFTEKCNEMATELEEQGMSAMQQYSKGKNRRRFEMNDPLGYEAYFTAFSEHSVLGKANTLRGFQGQRPDWYTLEAELQTLQVPTLVVVGDEDDPCIQPALFLKRHIPASGLAIFPQCGHAPNAEEPAKFNQALDDFFAQVQAGRWVPLEGHTQDKFSKSMVGEVGTNSST